MDLKEAIYKRRAVREFTAEPVAEETLLQLIDAAVQAPSAVNQQPWSFSVLRDKLLLAQILGDSKAYMLRTSPMVLSHHFQEALSDPKFDIFYHAPVLIVISSVAESPWAIENCALAAENLMPEGKAALHLPAKYAPVAPIIVGHPKSAPQPVFRKEPEIQWIGP